MYRNIGLGAWMARRANITPDRVALAFAERRLTYRELSERIQRLARGFQQRGIGPGDRVAFLGRNHPAALETLFACGLLGAIAVPLHPGFDDVFLAKVLANAEPAALVFTPDMSPAIERLRSVIEMPGCFTTGIAASAGERLEDLIRAGSDEPIDRAVGLEQTCLLAFSSGTTGPNKGVQLTHGNVLFNVMNTLSCFDFVSDDVILTSAPLYRMGGLGFTLAILFKGGTCVLQEHADPSESLRLIERHGVTVLFDAVGPLDALQRAASSSAIDLSSLRVCVTGGSQVPVELVDAFARHGVCLQPGYGLTEAAPVALVVDRAEVQSHPGAAGRPPLFVAVRVVDGDLEDVAPGDVGELLVSGPNVMAGYWRDPDATSRTLVDGWLRTGDAACATSDGMVTIVGRVADALQIEGRVIHPGPIEAALRAQGAVIDCAIVQDAPGGLPLVFVVPPPAQPVDRARMVDLCRVLLGTQVAPELHVVRALPKNPNGKIMRALLRTAPRLAEAG